MTTPQGAAAQSQGDPPPPARWERLIPTSTRQRLVTATAVIMVATAALGLIVATVPNEPVGQPSQNTAQSAVGESDHSGAAARQDSVHVSPYGPPYGADVVLQRACGAIIMIDALARDASDPEPDPGKVAMPADGHTLIGYANALNHVAGQGLSDTLKAAITAHVYALTNLGAMINHHAADDDVSSMAIVVETTAAVLREFCAS